MENMANLDKKQKTELPLRLHFFSTQSLEFREYLTWTF